MLKQNDNNRIYPWRRKDYVEIPQVTISGEEFARLCPPAVMPDINLDASDDEDSAASNEDIARDEDTSGDYTPKQPPQKPRSRARQTRISKPSLKARLQSAQATDPPRKTTASTRKRTQKEGESIHANVQATQLLRTQTTKATHAQLPKRLRLCK